MMMSIEDLESPIAVRQEFGTPAVIRKCSWRRQGIINSVITRAEISVSARDHFLQRKPPVKLYRVAIGVK